MMRWLILPIGSLVNAMALLLLTALDVPFSALSVTVANVVFATILLFSIKPYIKPHSIIPTPRSRMGILGVLSLVIILFTVLYGSVHSVLPTAQYDSLTNWNMRSKVSYFRAELIFERMDGLIEKPHYPVLHHALQVTAMQFVPGWQEPVANGVTWLLCLNLLVLIYLLLREYGYESAIIALASIAGLPLLAMHTGQGYADLPLVLYAVVSLLLFQRFLQKQNVSDLMLSGVMVTACVWTKTEGLFFCLVPWLIMTLLYARRIRYAMVWTTTVSLLWPAFVLANGYNLTPHGSADTGFSISTEAMQTLFAALFVHGSFGIFWYLALVVGLWCAVRRQWSPAMLWGVLSFLGYCAVYVFTSNAEYLILGQSFDRQMLLPASLLIVAFAMHLHKYDSVLIR